MSKQQIAEINTNDSSVQCVKEKESDGENVHCADLIVKHFDDPEQSILEISKMKETDRDALERYVRGIIEKIDAVQNPLK